MRPAALRLAAFAALADAAAARAARCEGLAEWLYESADWAPPGYHVCSGCMDTCMDISIYIIYIYIYIYIHIIVI